MGRSIENLEEATANLKRYGELVEKLSVKLFNPVNTGGKPMRRLTRDEDDELIDLKLYFNGRRLNEAALEVAQACILELVKAKAGRTGGLKSWLYPW